MSDRRISDQHYMLGGEYMICHDCKYLKERLRIKETKRLNLQIDLMHCHHKIKTRELKQKIEELDFEIASLKKEIASMERQIYEQANN